MLNMIVKLKEVSLSTVLSACPVRFQDGQTTAITTLPRACFISKHQKASAVLLIGQHPSITNLIYPSIKKTLLKSKSF